MSEPCIFEQDIGYIKAKLDSIERNLNGNVKEIKQHIEESRIYRKKVDELWVGVHFTKWIIGFLLGTGIIFYFLRR